jgi:prophage maintenance system killer protein
MARLVRTQGFTEGNKRTAFALGAWTLEQNGLSAKLILQASDMSILDLSLKAARGADIAEDLVELLPARASDL